MSYFSTPIRLVQNKIVRYPGGREIDRFRGITPPMDDGRPEAWVGSTVTTVGAGTNGKDSTDGMASCILPSGREMLLKEAILLDTKGALGLDHVKEHGNEPAVLVKILDAQYQLGFQCHPTPEYALAHWGEKYGKAECWYILSLREDVEEEPYVLLGFKEGITREKFTECFDKGDIKEIDNLLHKIPVTPGELYWVGPGVPHAVGAGVLCIEAQEPSDITLGARPLNFHYPDATPEAVEKHRNRLLGAYAYDGCTYEDNLKARRIEPVVLSRDGLSQELLLIGEKQTPCFSLSRIEAKGKFTPMATGRCAILIVTQGEGELICDSGSISVKCGDEIFIGADVKNLSYVPKGESMTVIVSHPPGASWD